MEITILSASEVHRRKNANEPIDLLDVRTPLEYREVHAVDTELVPLDRLDPAAFKNRAPGRMLAVLCKSGGRAKQACEKLAAAGVPGLILVEGPHGSPPDCQLSVAKKACLWKGKYASPLGHSPSPAWFWVGWCTLTFLGFQVLWVPG